MILSWLACSPTKASTISNRLKHLFAVLLIISLYIVFCGPFEFSSVLNLQISHHNWTTFVQKFGFFRGEAFESFGSNDTIPAMKNWTIYQNASEIDQPLLTNGSVLHRTGINCAALFKGDTKEIARAVKYTEKIPKPVIWTAERYNQSTNNCTEFKMEAGYLTKPASKEEAEFPIAFSIVMYKDYEQTERLLRAIYRPQNFYCIHPDARANNEVHQTLQAIVRCFDNVFIAPKLWKVYWGHINLMYAERTCLSKLVNYSWKYFINLSGQMFPLRTNFELVKILKLYDGANDIEGRHKEALDFRGRYETKWRLVEKLNANEDTSEKKPPPPYNVTIYKGTNNAALSRAFVEYFLLSRSARNLMEYFADTNIPDEFVWPTLNRNARLRAPGGYSGSLESYVSNVRLTVWAEQMRGMECSGRFIRTVCNFGVKDLAWLDTRPEMFANKFNTEYHWLAYDCMEERLLNRTLDSLNRDNFNMTYYYDLPFVKNRSKVKLSVNQRYKKL